MTPLVNIQRMFDRPPTVASMYVHYDIVGRGHLTHIIIISDLRAEIFNHKQLSKKMGLLTVNFIKELLLVNLKWPSKKKYMLMHLKWQSKKE